MHIQGDKCTGILKHFIITSESGRWSASYTATKHVRFTSCTWRGQIFTAHLKPKPRTFPRAFGPKRVSDGVTLNLFEFLWETLISSPPSIYNIISSYARGYICIGAARGRTFSWCLSLCTLMYVYICKRPGNETMRMYIDV